MDQCSETKKLLGDQILNFALDFLEIGELWPTYFDVFGKRSGIATSAQNFMGQSSETKKLLRDQIFELWSRFA